MRAHHVGSRTCKPSAGSPKRASDGAPVHYERDRPRRPRNHAIPMGGGERGKLHRLHRSQHRRRTPRFIKGRVRRFVRVRHPGAQHSFQTKVCAAASAATTSCWPAAASSGASVPYAARAGCRRPRHTWSPTSSVGHVERTPLKRPHAVKARARRWSEALGRATGRSGAGCFLRPLRWRSHPDASGDERCRRPCD